MKNQVKSFVTLLFVTVWFTADLYGSDNETRSYQAYLSGIKSFWKQAVQEKQQEYESSPGNKQRYELSLTLYGLLGATFRDEDEKMFDEFVDQTEAHLQALSKGTPYEAEAKALLSSVYGYKIAYDPWKGMFLGGKSSKLVEEAVEMAPDSPIAWKMFAGSKHHTPAAFGGDVATAIEAYQKAIKLWQENNQEKNNWLYLDTYVWLGMAYKEQGMEVEANEIFRKALDHEPQFSWVRSLLPGPTE
jgi:tetratricopeptide (TPR) repeat protein